MSLFRTGVVIGFVAAVLASTSVARADGYFFNEGLGPGASVRKEMAEVFESSGISLRLGFGKRVGNWSVEGVFFGSNLDVNESGQALSPSAGMSEMTALSYGADARRYFRVGSNLELYLRAGLHGVAMTSVAGYQDPQDLQAYGGRGYDLGGGIQWTVRPFDRLRSSGLYGNPLRRMEIGLWADFTQQVLRLHKSGAASLDGGLEMWTFGFAIGSEI